jgi:hypothetical protein
MTREERRKAMPQTTKFIDDMRSAFGELAGIHAEENGHTVKWGEKVTQGIEVVALPSPSYRKD